MLILLLGEAAGSARYLLGAFDRVGHQVHHIEARERVERVDDPFDVVLLSDEPAAHVSDAAFATIVQRVEAGSGLVMIGGWTSFTGMGKSYGVTPLAPLLPVRCGPTDDRRNAWQGLWFEAVAPEHPLLRGLDVANPPVLCGYNDVTVADGATLVAQARHVAFQSGQAVAGAAVPLLAARTVGKGRSLAFTSDLVPHWCGGIVDWGAERVKLSTGAEVGAGYVTFLSNLVRWAAGGD